MLNNLLAWHRLPTVFAENSANAGESARSLLQRGEFSKLTDGFMFALRIYTKRTFDAAEN
jgi:hypothetical protein